MAKKGTKFLFMREEDAREWHKDAITLGRLRDLLSDTGSGSKVGLRSEGKYIFITAEDPGQRTDILGLLADLRDRVR